MIAKYARDTDPIKLAKQATSFSLLDRLLGEEASKTIVDPSRNSHWATLIDDPGLHTNSGTAEQLYLDGIETALAAAEEYEKAHSISRALYHSARRLAEIGFVSSTVGATLESLNRTSGWPMGVAIAGLSAYVVCRAHERSKQRQTATDQLEQYIQSIDDSHADAHPQTPANGTVPGVENTSSGYDSSSDTDQADSKNTPL